MNSQEISSCDNRWSAGGQLQVYACRQTRSQQSINVLLAVLIQMSQRLPGVVLMAIPKPFHKKLLAIASTPSDLPHV
jgi:hypothetical protein